MCEYFQMFSNTRQMLSDPFKIIVLKPCHVKDALRLPQWLKESL